MTEIYKTTCNICNLIYLGKHKVYNRESNNYLGSGKKFKQHLKEHKKENQIKQILLYCEDNDVKYYEEALIKLYDSTNPEIGLNISKKSKGLHEFTNEHKQKLSKSHSGKNNYWSGKQHSKETKQLMKINHADFSGENNPNYGKKQSEKTIKKRIKNLQKSIIVYKNKKYIGIFKSIKQASKKLNLWATCISAVLNNRRKSTGGYYFRYYAN